MPQRSANVASGFYHHCSLSAKWSSRIFPIDHHFRPRLRRQANRLDANSWRCDSSRQCSPRYLERFQIQCSSPKHHLLVCRRWAAWREPSRFLASGSECRKVGRELHYARRRGILAVLVCICGCQYGGPYEKGHDERNLAVGPILHY
jgi:hypothetical protein